MKKLIYILFLSFLSINALAKQINTICKSIDINTLFEHEECINKSSKDDLYSLLKKLIKNEDSDEALYILKKIEPINQIQPKYNEIYFNALYGNAEYDKAIEFYNSNSYLEKNEYIYTKYLICLIKEGKSKQVKKDLNKYKFRNKDNYNFIKGILDFNDLKYYSAINHLEKISKNYENYTDTKIITAEACFNIKRYNCSKKNYSKANLDTDYSKFKIKDIENHKLNFNFIAVLGEQYDSNVTSVDENYTDITEKDSMRTYVIANIETNYNFLNDFEISAGIDNYASWNHSVSDFNTRIHAFKASLLKRLNNFDIKLPELTYELTYMDESSYLNSIKAETSATLHLNSFEISLPISYLNKDFKAGEYEDDRDSNVYGIGINLKYRFSDTFYTKINLNYYDENANEDYFDNNVISSSLLISYKFFQRFSIGGEYSYEYYDYKNNRNDYHNRITGIITYRVSKLFNIAVDGSYINHDSNRDEQKYDKYVFGASIAFDY